MEGSRLFRKQILSLSDTEDKHRTRFGFFPHFKIKSTEQTRRGIFPESSIFFQILQCFIECSNNALKHAGFQIPFFLILSRTKAQLVAQQFGKFVAFLCKVPRTIFSIVPRGLGGLPPVQECVIG